MAQEYKGKVKVVALDANTNYDTTASYGVMGLPTLIFFKGGKEVARMVGTVPKQKIVDEIKKSLGA